MIPKEKLDEHIPSSPAAALLIVFKAKRKIMRVPNGVFCGVVASFLHQHDWTMEFSDCMKRNVVKLSHNDGSMWMTFINRQTFFEVYIHDAIEDELDTLCPELHKTVFTAIEEVMHTFRYKNLHPERAFYCPCGDKDVHAAEKVKRSEMKYFKCTKKNKTIGKIQESNYLLWDGIATPEGPPANKRGI